MVKLRSALAPISPQPSAQSLPPPSPTPPSPPHLLPRVDTIEVPNRSAVFSFFRQTLFSRPESPFSRRERLCVAPSLFDVPYFTGSGKKKVSSTFLLPPVCDQSPPDDALAHSGVFPAVAIGATDQYQEKGQACGRNVDRRCSSRISKEKNIRRVDLYDPQSSSLTKPVSFSAGDRHCSLFDRRAPYLTVIKRLLSLTPPSSTRWVSQQDPSEEPTHLFIMRSTQQALVAVTGLIIGTATASSHQHFHSPVEPRQVAPNIQSEDCYSSLGDLSYADTWTWQSTSHCGNLCFGKGKAVFALYNSNQCACGDSLPAASDKIASSQCSQTCPGYLGDFCKSHSLSPSLSSKPY